MRIADRIRRLGTETAFAVAGRAAAHAATGATVYPFHLGDLNFKTPRVIIEAATRAMHDGKTGYCPSAGIAPLRDALAQDANSRRGTRYSAENVSIQPGGKPVIGKFLQVVMNPGDAVLCPTPGYPIYESQVQFLGGRVAPYGFVSGSDGFRIDFDSLERSLTPDVTVLIVNDFHNPTGAACSAEDRERLAAIAVRHDLMVLLDEAYFEMCYNGPAHSIVSLPGMEDRSVLLYTFSKKFAMTGWRLGAAIGPREIIEIISTINLNDESCSNHFIQHAVLAGLTGNLSEPGEILAALRERRDAAVAILNDTPGVRCFSPSASFYLFPDVTELMARKGFGQDYPAFSEDVLTRTGVSLCTRLHFGASLPGETRCFVRLAFSGINTESIREGLGTFRDYAMR